MAATGIRGEQSGISAEAWIGPGGVRGSSPDTKIMAHTMARLEMRLPTSNNWIRGHLLNDNLGGSGKMNDNLAPMSHTTNMQWNRAFEQPMKQAATLLNSAYLYTRAQPSYYVLLGYRATASGAYGPALAHGITIPATFTGEWYYVAKDRSSGSTYRAGAEYDAALAELGQYKDMIEGLLGGAPIVVNQTH